MSDPHDPAEPEAATPRDRWAGRLLIIALGVLLAAYAVVTFMH